MSKEIVLPAHLYDRIKASAGEHGGIGRGRLFSDGDPVADGRPASGVPVCVHGHAWGTCTRYIRETMDTIQYQEPELAQYITVSDNDTELHYAWKTGRVPGERVSFDFWCELLNVKRGEDVPRETPAERQTEMAAV